MRHGNGCLTRRHRGGDDARVGRGVGGPTNRHRSAGDRFLRCANLDPECGGRCLRAGVARKEQRQRQEQKTRRYIITARVNMNGTMSTNQRMQ